MYKVIKRVLDFVSAFCLFAVLCPLFLIIIVISIISNGFPVFFVQRRSGKNMKVINVLKFRTMTNKKDENGLLLPDEKRLTKFGKILRSTSLDELPQLLNIIVGNMSVIGPRPLPEEYDDYYTEEEKSRFKVRMGLIQPEVLYNKIFPSWDEQLLWEANYANNLCFKTDVKIFFAVFKVLFKRSKDNYGSFVRKSLIEERKNDCFDSPA